MLAWRWIYCSFGGLSTVVALLRRFPFCDEWLVGWLVSDWLTDRRADRPTDRPADGPDPTRSLSDRGWWVEGVTCWCLGANRDDE